MLGVLIDMDKDLCLDLDPRGQHIAWRLFDEGRPMELVSESIIEVCNLYEVLRSIHVALLCVQGNRVDRPSMSSVVLMLGNEDPLPQPKHPSFFIERDPIEPSSPSRENHIHLTSARF
ncbi:unnamed protein product [Dovyalis caffra]|uniref:S-locus receptor kinase C-terminal domain-containing protein n=1 Tax=Dovyalis caffra TaxID=77055 RepID=A0AAV1R0F1_9ROSI|nr:unnamed protein product [Dovyalis caffra]